MKIQANDLGAINERLCAADAITILRWAHDTFGQRAAILSSMQKAGAALCHMADRAGLPFDVLFVDTGVLHKETLETRDRLAQSHRRLNVLTLTPERSFLQQTRDEGLLYITKEGQERCCDLRKSAPLHALAGRYDALIGALRRGEGGARARVAPVELDPAMRALRIHPLSAWTDDDLEAYVAAHDSVVVNPLHDMGFPTIGCFPCTTPVRSDEPRRAGRWRHLADVTYCGINPTDGGAPLPSIELDERYRRALALD